MGLSAPKRRNKISDDPNNLSWANSTDTFGHRILTAQGWRPGDYLGARDAMHAEHYTEANASSIRVMLREDNLGLGAQLGKAGAETFGLSMFSNLLGRLNGKNDAEIQAQQSAQRDVQLRMYQADRFGAMNFVYGGLLLGDETKEDDTKDAHTEEGTAGDATLKQHTPQGSKRRTRHDVHTGTESAQKKRKKRETEEGSQSCPDADTRMAESHLAAKSKKRKARDKVDVEGAISRDVTVSPDGGGKRTLGKKREKRAREAEVTEAAKEKRARKEERRRRKAEKRKREPEKDDDSTESEQPVRRSEVQGDSTTASLAGLRSVSVPSNRNAVRHRYIQQKRMASLNPQALKEIFMLKTAS